MSGSTRKDQELRNLIADRGDLLRRAAVPIFSKGENNCPAIEGTGFVVEKEKRTFLVSAAHVLCRYLHEKRELYIYVTESTQRKIEGDGTLTIPAQKGNWNTDSVDVGVVELVPPVKVNSRIQAIIPFSTLKVEKNHLGRRGYVVTGFPKNKIGLRRDLKTINPQPVVYWNGVAELADYQRKRLRSEDYILLPFDRRKSLHVNGSEGAAPNPDGMSGSPVWLLWDEDNPEANRYETVAGIAIEHDPSNKYMIAVDIEPAIDMINQIIRDRVVTLPNDQMIVIPTQTQEILDEVEKSNARVELQSLGTRLAPVQRIEGLSDAQKNGAFIEMSAFSFSESPIGELSEWDTHFGPTFRATRLDGTVELVPDIAEFDLEALNHWEARAKVCSHPYLRARYADLVWDLTYYLTKKKAAYQNATIAVDSYLESADQNLCKSETSKLFACARSLDISIQLKDKVRIEKSKLSLFKLLQSAVQNRKIGIWSTIFDSLIDNKNASLSEQEVSHLLSTLESILSSSSDSTNNAEFDPWTAKASGERLAQYYKKNGQQSEVERVVRKYGKAFEDICEQAEPLTAMSWLQDVMEDYRSHGLKADAERVQIAGLKKGKDAPSGMARIEQSVTFNKQEVDNFLESLTNGDADKVLGRIAHHFIPSLAEQRSLLEKLQFDEPLLARISIETIKGGHVTGRAGSVEDDPDGRLIYQLSQSVSANYMFLGEALRIAKDKKLLNLDSALSYIFSSPLFEDGRRSLIKYGLEAYLKDDFIGTIHILVPQMEQALRVGLGLLGVPTNQPKKGNPGVMESKTLGVVLRDPILTAAIGEDLQRYLVMLLTEDRGLNLRNDFAHGLLEVEAFTRSMADLVLHGLFSIALIRPVAEEIAIDPETEIDSVTTADSSEIVSETQVGGESD